MQKYFYVKKKVIAPVWDIKKPCWDKFQNILKSCVFNVGSRTVDINRL